LLNHIYKFAFKLNYNNNTNFIDYLLKTILEAKKLENNDISNLLMLFIPLMIDCEGKYKYKNIDLSAIINLYSSFQNLIMRILNCLILQMIIWRKI